MNSKHKLLLLFLVFAAVSVSSCGTVKPGHAIIRTEYIDRIFRDTTYRRDSVYQKEYVKGDTVFRDRLIDRFLYRDRVIKDSIKLEVHDTTTILQPVEKELSAVQKFKLRSFWWLLTITIALLMWTFRRVIFK